MLGEDFQEVFHGLGGGHVHEVTAEVSGRGQLSGVEEFFFFARAGLGDVEGGEDALVGQAAFEGEFHVAGAFELFEDDLIHAGAGVDEAGGEDGE